MTCSVIHHVTISRRENVSELKRMTLSKGLLVVSLTSVFQKKK